MNNFERSTTLGQQWQKKIPCYFNTSMNPQVTGSFLTTCDNARDDLNPKLNDN